MPRSPRDDQNLRLWPATWPLSTTSRGADPAGRCPHGLISGSMSNHLLVSTGNPHRGVSQHGRHESRPTPIPPMLGCPGGSVSTRTTGEYGPHPAPSRLMMVHASHGPRVFGPANSPRRRTSAKRRTSTHPQMADLGPEWVCVAVSPGHGRVPWPRTFVRPKCEKPLRLGAHGRAIRNVIPRLEHRQQRHREQSTRNAGGTMPTVNGRMT